MKPRDDRRLVELLRGGGSVRGDGEALGVSVAVPLRLLEGQILCLHRGHRACQSLLQRREPLTGCERCARGFGRHPVAIRGRQRGPRLRPVGLIRHAETRRTEETLSVGERRLLLVGGGPNRRRDLRAHRTLTRCLPTERHASRHAWVFNALERSHLRSITTRSPKTPDSS